MRERPILFSAPMVRAIHEGRKTQTRRICKAALDVTGKEFRDADGWPMRDDNGCGEVRAGCPYGVPGDRLWVREAWAVPHKYDGIPPRLLPVDARVHFSATEDRGGLLWRPSVNMPRWASRITLEIVGVRVERLQNLRGRCLDFETEGITIAPSDPFPHTNCVSKLESAFRKLWDSLNAKRGYGWDANPWVWRIEFKRIAPAEREG